MSTKQICFHEEPKPGDVVYLVHVQFNNTGDTRLDAHTKPQRKNMSGEQCEEGWLGETDNINLQALGKFRVVSVEPEGEYWLTGRKTELEKL